MAAHVVDPRSLQANERTLLAWIRTGLALMAFGFLIDRMALWLRFEVHEHHDVSLVLGAVIIGVGAACQLIGAVRFIAMRRALVAGRSYVPGLSGPITLAVLVTLFGAALVVYLLLA